MTTFLPHDQIPPNLLRLHLGDKVRVVTPRAFVRAGYRLRAVDLHEEVDDALKDARGAPLRACFTALLDTLEPPKVAVATRGQLPDRLHNRLVHALALELVQARRFGGPSRGVHVLPWSPWASAPSRVFGRTVARDIAPAGAELTVENTYVVQAGRYYAPSRGTPPYYDDAEQGGLSQRRSVVIVVVRDHHQYYAPVLSGDLERVA